MEKYKLPQKIVNLLPYEPISGDYRIRLDANESFFKLSSDEIMKAVANVEINRYPDPYAIELLEAYGKLYNIDKKYLTAGNGSDELISIITGCFLDKGDKVLAFTPDFSMYWFYPSLYELDVVKINKDKDLEIDIKSAIIKIEEEKIGCVIFSNPCNPTSIGLSKEKIRPLLETGVLVIIDEAYMEFWDEKESYLNEIENYENLIVLKTCSKAYGMAGARIGIMAANEKLTRAVRAAKSPYNVNTLSQALGKYVLSNKTDLDSKVKAIKQSAKYLYDEIVKIELPEFERIYDSVTNFVFIKTSKANEICSFLKDEGIAIRNMHDYIRISAGSTHENKAIIDALNVYKSKK